MSPDPIAATGAGRVRGNDRRGAAEFLGIPYGRAERYAPPGPVTPWTGVRDAHRPGPAAPQPERAVALATHGPCPEQSEDCLNLNVWTPASEGRRPVLVWLHGGGFTIGHATASLYDGAGLSAAGDIVVVTLNYRLGSFGWLGHPDLADRPGDPAANWGLLDQIAALRWVRENIASFGGDPDRVTVAGQSAGALSAMDLLVAPAGQGLARRAILQSPPLGDLAQPADRAVAWAHALSRAADPDGDGDPRTLRTVPAHRIIALHEELLESPAFRGSRGGALPTLDAATIPASPRHEPGAQPAIDVLVGANADEGTFFFGAPWRPAPPAERISAIAGHLTHGDGDAALASARHEAELCGGSIEPLELLRRVATEAMVAGPVAVWAADRATAVGESGGRVYRYRFDHPGAGPDLRATHTAEVPLLFGTWRDGGPGQRLGGAAPHAEDGPSAEDVAGAVQTAWIGFIRRGDPGWSPVAPGERDPEMGIFGGAERLRIGTRAEV